MKEQPTFELGLYTLADKNAFANTEAGFNYKKDRLTNILKVAELADEAGLDLFGIGNPARTEFAISTPSIVAAHLTGLLKLICIDSNPVQLFEKFVTLTGEYDGELEFIINREAIIEEMQAAGYDLGKCSKLIEKYVDSLPLAVKVEHDTDSAAQAGKIGAKLALAVLGGEPEQFKPVVEAYRQEADAAAVPQARQQIMVTGHMYLAESDSLAKRQFYPYYRQYWRNVQAEQVGADITEEQFDRMSTPDSALFVGSPELIIEKILQQHELFGHSRFLARVDIGDLPFKYVAKTIEYFAERVAPVVRKEIKC